MQKKKISDTFALLNSEVAYTRNIHSNKTGKSVFCSDEWGNVRRLTFKFFENPLTLPPKKHPGISGSTCTIVDVSP